MGNLVNCNDVAVGSDSDRNERVVNVINHYTHSFDNKVEPIVNGLEFHPSNIIDMTLQQACNYIREHTPKQTDTSEKIYYIYVVKKDGELQEAKRIFNRKGLDVKTVGGKITKIYDGHKRGPVEK